MTQQKLKIKLFGANGNTLTQISRIESGLKSLGHEIIDNDGAGIVFTNDAGYHDFAIQYKKNNPNSKLILNVLDLPVHCREINDIIAKFYYTLQFADYVTTISETVKNQLLNVFPFLQKKGVKVIYQPTKPVAPLNLKRNNNLLIVGRVCDPNKNFNKAIELAGLTNHIINIVGPEDPTNLAKGNYKKFINYLGILSDEDLNKEYNTCKAVLCPSKIEGLNLPMIESLICKTPVLVWETMQTAQEFAPQEFICKDSMFDLFNKLNYITSGSDQVNKILNQYSEKYIKQFSPELVANNIIKVYGQK